MRTRGGRSNCIWAPCATPTAAGLAEFGPDTGYDSIGDYPQAERLVRYLDQLETAGKLPKMILYSVNPADNYVLATMIGNFQDGSIPGKLQFGSGWWFLDQKEGMEWQLNALSNVGLLSRFVGMLTDSRSFMSYPRHEYFRRILCNLLGAEVERGEIPNDEGFLATWSAGSASKMPKRTSGWNAGRFGGVRSVRSYRRRNARSGAMPHELQCCVGGGVSGPVERVQVGRTLVLDRTPGLLSSDSL